MWSPPAILPKSSKPDSLHRIRLKIFPQSTPVKYNKLKILHLPTNIASQTSITIRALRDIGVDARGIIINADKIQSQTRLKNFQIESRKEHPLKSTLQTLKSLPDLLKAIHWSDMVHWHYDTQILPFNLDLRYITLKKRPGVVEFWGSEIRDPVLASMDNPFMASYYQANPQEAAFSSQRSQATQKRFARYGFSCLLPGLEMAPYINNQQFPQIYSTRARLILSEFNPRYPSPHNTRPLIVHVPSRQKIKGTEHVLAVIERLKQKYSFGFKLIHNTEHTQALRLIQDCDIMIDQMNIGDHGVAAIEAMALGKPTVCYIKQSLLEHYPPGFPIVNASVDTLEDTLANLLSNSGLRHEIGQKSRVYVETYHDAHKIAYELVDIYRELLCR